MLSQCPRANFVLGTTSLLTQHLQPHKALFIVLLLSLGFKPHSVLAVGTIALQPPLPILLTIAHRTMILPCPLMMRAFPQASQFVLSSLLLLLSGYECPV
jgi:hypothetical protein